MPVDQECSFWRVIKNYRKMFPAGLREFFWVFFYSAIYNCFF